MATIVRKKPCPYCGKKLQAKTAKQFRRNNLPRHLNRGTCRPYERMRLRGLIEIASRLIDIFQLPTPSEQALEAAMEAGLKELCPGYVPIAERPAVDELNRLYALETPKPWS